MTRRHFVLSCCLVCAACAAPAQPDPARVEDSVVPGSIGALVRHEPAGVTVSALGSNSPAAAAGLRVGDIILRYNGEAVREPRQFYRLVLDSRPGSVARLEVLREGATRALEVPVRELDTMPRV